MNHYINNINVFYKNTSIDHGTQHLHTHSHSHYEIYYFHKGNCKYLIDDDVIRLENNDLIIMNGTSLHGPYLQKETPYIRSVVEFSAEWIRPIIKQLKVPMLLDPFEKLTNSLYRGVDQQTLDKINAALEALHLKKMYLADLTLSDLEKDLLEGQIINHFVALLFMIYEISNKELIKIPLANNEKNNHVNRLITWIDQNYQRNITLDEMADNLHLSKYYMSRIFKDITGKTIMQYLINRRLVRTKYLLEMYPDKSMVDIAMESGFESPSHFSRKFKDHYHISPTEYRSLKLSK
ncbi:AraC family transcriptional regulator [Gracilibacillus alcaliphilus]|uniref:AraC family transcriptional regulator n=1 Tax=Gracilibacillus alcaliphilus TaxID=1401441 RepID=UPI00195E241C|nr:AraC family transcriptional regulator [Gracilibacillus alcaliphilus]MBM7679002.1 AraC-like DNA-binding protein [Gracilibacillus alcaliphilus]